MKAFRYVIILLLVSCIFLSACYPDTEAVGEIPVYTGKPYTVIQDNIPSFTQQELSTVAFEMYAPLDSLGRCGVAEACIGRELMPTEDRGSIGQVKPSGWQTVKYDFVDGKYLYNRCHLIGFQLTGENANKRNLITGTRYMNVQGMLPFEDVVADYIKETDNHILYRVTPVYVGKELVARGVIMEALSVEDEGEGISFCVFVHNVQPGVEIDYTTGKSREIPLVQQEDTNCYILNTNSHKFHRENCQSVSDMKPENKQEYEGNRDDLLAMGYQPCGSCKP